MDLENMVDDVPHPTHNEPEMSDLIAETNDLYQKLEQDHNLSDKIDQGVEQMEELNQVTAVAAEAAPLTAQQLRFAGLIIKQSTGENVLGHNLMGMENAEDDNKHQTRIALETIKETLRSFYQALKRTFYSIWASIKTWYIKVASLRASIERKAKDLLEKANAVTGSPKESSFEFKRAKDLHNDRKLSYQTLYPAFDNLIKFTSQSLNVKRDSEFENFISTAEKMVEKLKASADSDVDDTDLVKFEGLFIPTPATPTTSVDDPELKKIYQDAENNTLIITKAFPGDRAAIISSPSSTAGLSPVEHIRNCWIRLAPNKAKPADIDGITVRTFYPAQVARFAEMVQESCDAILFFDKAWQRRDRFMNKIFKELDRQIDQIDKGLTDSSSDTKVENETKGLIRAIITAIKRSNTFNANLINYNLKVSAAVLDLGNACLLQYK